VKRNLSFSRQASERGETRREVHGVGECCSASSLFPKINLFLFFITLLLLGAPVSGCTKEEYDEAHYTKVHTIVLLPKETKDPNAAPPVPPYYQLKVPRGYLSNDTTQHTSFVFEPLYPSMEHFTPARREAWYTKTPKGDWGQQVKDVLRIFVEYWTTIGNDEGALRVDSLERQREAGYLEVVPAPKVITSAIPTLRVYQGRQNRLGTHYVFRQVDGRTVAVKCDMECTGHTTWNSKLRVHYRFPEARLSQMAEIDLAVNRLLDSFNPILIAQGR
jgi:hypothetical protein